MKRVLSVLLAVSALLAGCGPAGEPRTLVPPVPAERPMPAGVQFNAKPPDGGGSGGGPDCGDPTASLRPSGLAVREGTAMAAIKQRGRLIVGVDQNTYLMSFRDPATGTLEGFDVDIAREVAAHLLGDPDKVQFKVLRVDERIPALQAGEVDLVVYAMTINCDRRKDVEFSSVYFESGQRILVRKGSGYKSLQDLGGKKVCAPAGSTSLTNLANADVKVELVAVADMADCLLLLQQRLVDAFSTDDTILAGMARQDPTTEVIGETFSSEPYGIGVRKDSPELVRYVNAVLQDIRNKSWQDIYQRWLEPVLGPAIPPKPIYR